MAKTDWANGDKLTAEAMNTLGAEVGGKANKSDIPSVPAAPTADTLSGATATGKAVLKATDQAAARSAIGAGTGSSNLALGTTATTAAKGDHVHAYEDLTGKPTIPAATASGTRAQLDAGTDTVARAFSAKDISEYVAAQIASAGEPPAEG